MGIIFLSGCSPVKPFQPNVSQGGRAVSIAVNPNNGQQMMVASETGGLFSTTDGGITWQHVDGLKNFNVNDVAYANPTAAVNLIVATAFGDYTAKDNGFIWRSPDNGHTWSQPAGSIPPPSPPGCVGSGCVGCPERPSAHGVSFEAGTPNVFVASDCGLAVSKDTGVTWGINQPLLGQLGPNHTVNAVLAQPGGSILVRMATIPHCGHARNGGALAQGRIPFVLEADFQGQEARRKTTDVEGGSGIDIPAGR